MAHLYLSLWSRVTRAGTERWKTSTVATWGYWLRALRVTVGEGLPGVKSQQDSPGIAVDSIWVAGGQRTQVRNSAQKGLHVGKGVMLSCRAAEVSVRASALPGVDGAPSAILSPPRRLLLRSSSRL